MSRHRMPPGGAADSGKETIDVADDANTEDAQTGQAAETVESAVETADSGAEPLESTEESAAKAEESTDSTDESDPEPVVESGADAEPPRAGRRVNWPRVIAYGLLPAIALLLALASGYLKWEDNSVRDSKVARVESMQAAKDSTIAMLSYKPDTVEKQLTDARNLLTGQFRDSYTSLTNDVVIPGAKQKQISAVATVPAVASVSADANHAVVLVFVNQTVVVGQTTPTDSASSVRVTMDKVGDRWLISGFDPV